MKTIYVLIFSLITQLSTAQYSSKPYSQNYLHMRDSLATGWNTWNANSMLSHVILPEGFAINLSFKANDFVRQGQAAINRPTVIKSFNKETDRRYTDLSAINRPEQIEPGLRSDDGSYTSLKITWSGTESKIETATINHDIVMLVTVLKSGEHKFLVVEPGLLWNRDGYVRKKENKLVAVLPHREIEVSTTSDLVTDYTVPAFTKYLSIKLQDEIGIYTGSGSKTLAEIKAIISTARQKQEAIANAYKGLVEEYKAMQGVLAWNTIYDPENQRVITPVSRLWAANSGGWVLFDWDTYFASYMMSMFNKKLAYTNAIAITKEITAGGFVPNIAAPYGYKSTTQSQPPVGSFVIREIYRKYKEKWLLEEVYDDLITWNRWWPEKRNSQGYLCWGGTSWQGAAYESGLDNTPMYDKVPFNTQTGLLELADVGLMSFYVMDCDALADIARILGKTKDAKELSGRSIKYRSQLATLWNDPSGLYLNKRTDSLMFNTRISPTNFYPMMVGLPSQKQADRMIQEHYLNPLEFNGEYVIPSCPRNDPEFKGGEYWKGRIWGPMNFLVYLGFRKYEAADAQKELVQKSSKLLLQSWKENGAIFENYSAETGRGDDVHWSDSFYHWGALLGFISFIENGYVPPMEKAISQP